MPIYKRSFVALLLIAAAIFGGTIYGISASDEMSRLDKAVANDDNSAMSDVADSERKNIFVYVTGGVNKAGMVELKSDKVLRVLPTADVENINMAETISDGQHIRIPEKIVEQPVQSPLNDTTSSNSNNSGSSSKSADSGGIININTATSEELQTLKGIGPKTADKIIEYRQNNGAFKTIEDIQNVRGIGAKTFEKLKSRLKV